MTWAGISAPVSVTSEGKDWAKYVEVRILSANTQKKWLVVLANRGPSVSSPFRVTLLKLSTKATQAQELIGNKSIALTLEGANTRFDIDLTQSMFAVLVFDK